MRAPRFRDWAIRRRTGAHLTRASSGIGTSRTLFGQVICAVSASCTHVPFSPPCICTRHSTAPKHHTICFGAASSFEQTTIFAFLTKVSSEIDSAVVTPAGPGPRAVNSFEFAVARRVQRSLPYEAQCRWRNPCGCSALPHNVAADRPGWRRLPPSHIC